MLELKKKHEAAQAAFEAAKMTLEDAKRKYQDGAGKTYAETLRRAGEIDRLIGQQELLRTAAKQDLAEELRAAPSVVSAQAKSALAARRDAEDMLEQYQAIKTEASALVQANLAEASGAAKRYLNAYDVAALAWADLKVCSALLHCGEQIANAMAVRVPNGDGNCSSKMVKLLGQMVASYGEGHRPYVDEIGVVDLGLLDRDGLMTPIQMLAAQKALG